MSTTITEQTILDSLREIPEEQWGEVLRFLKEMNGADPGIRTGADLVGSGLVGTWADRGDLGSSREFARELRRRAEDRSGAGDASGH